MLYIFYNIYKKMNEDKKEHFGKNSPGFGVGTIIAILIELILVGLSAYISFDCNRYNGKSMVLSIIFAIFAAIAAPVYIFNWLVVTYLGLPCQKCAAAIIKK